MQQVALLFSPPLPNSFSGEAKSLGCLTLGHGALKKPVGAGSTTVASRGVGIHPWGAIAAHKRPLVSQPSCLQVPGSSAPEVSMKLSGHHGHPMEELIPPYKGPVLKGHRDDRSGMVRGPRHPWVPMAGGCHTARGFRDAWQTPKSKPTGLWDGRTGVQRRCPLLQTVSIPVSLVPCHRRRSRALAHHTRIGVYVFLFKPLQM